VAFLATALAVISMKNFLLSFFVIVAFSIYVLSEHLQGREIDIIPSPSESSSESRSPAPVLSTDFPNPTRSPTRLPTSSPTRLPTYSLTPSPTPSPTINLGQYKDGVYTGDIADAYYGNVQVQATIQNGKITDVQFLDYPQDRRTSIEINSQAMPYLKEEAIQAQSAQVDTVSGATQTSWAFRESLTSALDQARNI
jgi:uncharacterized protein with FMN-binding domain